MTESFETAPIASFTPLLVAEWMHEAPEARHRRLEGSLVFTDLSGFTAMSERLGALGKEGTEELVAQLGDVFRQQLELAASYGGQLIKFGGDALLLWFAHDGHEARACRAAFELQELLGRIGRRKTPAGVVEVSMTVGAHTGSFDFFLVGEEHRELVAAGAAATETVETEASAESGEVRLSAAMAARLPDEVVGEANEEGRFLLLAAPDAPTAGLGDTRWESLDPSGFVPSALRAEVAEGAEFAEHRQLVLGFVHLASVDDLLERLGGPRTGALLDRAMALIQHHLAAHEISFVSTDVYEGGPKIIVAGGAPRAHENDDERMLLAMRGAFDAVAASVPEITLKAGLNRGHGFWGLIGTDAQRRAVTMGDVVNTAARVMGKSGPGEILTTSGPLDRSRTLFDVDQLEPFAAKGKANKITAYRVGAIDGVRPMAADVSVPFLGRDREQRTLRERLRSLSSGTGGAVAISGPGGMGKSRLVEEALQTIEHTTVVRASGGAHATSTPYYPFRVLLRSTLQVSDAEQLVDAIDRRHPELRPWVPLLATAMGVTVESTPEVDRLADQAVSAKLAETLVRLLRSISTPMVWVIDDLHLVDVASATLLETIVGRADELALVIVATTRAEVAAPWTVLDLRPLDEDALGALVRHGAGRPLLPDQVAAAVERAGGNAMFALELGRGMRDGDDVDALPDTLEAVIGARIDALEVTERHLIRELSVLGLRFDPELARAVCGAGTFSLSTAAQEFVHFGADVVQFDHAIVREAAYESLAFRRRRTLHRRAGEWLEAARDHDEVIGDLSYHFWAARDVKRGLAYSRAAAAEARARFALVDAGALWRRALDLLPRARGITTRERGELWTEYANVIRLSDGVAAAGAFRRIRRLLSGHPDALARGLLEEAAWRLSRGEIQRAQAAARRGLDLLATSQERDLRTEVRLRVALGRCLDLLSNRDEARVVLHDAVALARRHGDAPGAANALGFLVLIEDDPEPCADEALAAFEENGSDVDAAGVLNNLAMRRSASGEWSSAAALYARAAEKFDRSGITEFVAMCRCNAGELLLQQGHYSAARDLFASAEEVFEALGLWLEAYARALRLVSDCFSGSSVDPDDVMEACGEIEESGSVEATVPAWEFAGLMAAARGRSDLVAHAVQRLEAAGRADLAAFVGHCATGVPTADQALFASVGPFERLLLSAAAADVHADSVRSQISALGIVALPPLEALAPGRQHLVAIDS